MASCCARRTSWTLPAGQGDGADLRHAGRADVGACRAWPWTTTSTSRLKPGDTVVLSSRIIPGNEKAIFRMIDHMSRRGADVLYGSMNPPLHVSGHGSARR